MLSITQAAISHYLWIKYFYTKILQSRIISAKTEGEGLTRKRGGALQIMGRGLAGQVMSTGEVFNLLVKCLSLD